MANARQRRSERRGVRLREDVAPPATVVETIRQEADGWYVYSLAGERIAGPFASEDEAKAEQAKAEAAPVETPAPVAVETPPPAPVIAPIIPIRATTLRASGHAVRILGKPLDAEGYRWPIAIIEAGYSTNKGPTGLPLYYGPDGLRASIAVWNGAKSYANHPTKSEEHDLPERDWTKVIGAISSAAWDQSVGKLGAVTGVWNIFDEAIHQKVMNAYKLGMLDSLGGFSIYARGETDANAKVDGQSVEMVTSITADVPPSVDAVTEPAAGGRFLTRLAASLRASEEVHAMKFSAFKAAKPALAEAILRSASDEDAARLLDSLEISFGAGERDAFLAEAVAARSALKASTPPAAPPAPAPVHAAAGTCPACGGSVPVGAAYCPTDGTKLEAVAVPASVTAPIAAALHESRSFLARLEARDKAATVSIVLAESKLDAKTQADLRPSLEKAKDEAEMRSLVEARRTYLASLVESGGFPVGTLRSLGDIQPGADGIDAYIAGIDGMLANEDVALNGTKVPRFHSVREAAQRHPRYRGSYVYLNPLDLFRECRTRYHGGFRNGGAAASYAFRESGAVKLSESSGTWLRESATTTGFGEIWADRAYKRMMTLYHSSNDVKEIAAWASDQESLPDFKSHRIIRLGEYNNPASVAEAGTYQAATTPADNEELTSLTKYGMIEDITMEALLGEDGKKLRSLPDRMIQAVLRLERETIINRITTTNPTLNSDSVALYHAGTHVNLLTTALSVNELAVVERAMMQRTSLTAASQLGSINRPRLLIVPPELMQLAERIVNPSGQWYTSVANSGTDVTLDPLLWKGRLTILVADHFTNATDWYVMADPKKMPTFQISRLQGVTQPELFTQDAEDSDSQFDTDKIRWKVRTFLGVEPLDFRAFHYSDVA